MHVGGGGGMYKGTSEQSSNRYSLSFFVLSTRPGREGRGYVGSDLTQ